MVREGPNKITHAQEWSRNGHPNHVSAEFNDQRCTIDFMAARYQTRLSIFKSTTDVLSHRIISISGPAQAYNVAVQPSGGHQTKIEQPSG